MNIIFRSVLGCLLVAQCVSASADEPLVSFSSLNPDTALVAAQAALASCRESDFQVAVSVVDRMGIVQVQLRDRYAGPHTPEAARRKAWTAVSFRSDTLSMSNVEDSQEQSSARFIEDTLMIGGGVPISASGSIVAGIGVSGAPTGADNHACAQAGFSAIAESLELAESD